MNNILIQEFYLDEIIKTALKEDINYIDVTTDFLLDTEKIISAIFISKDSGVLAGLPAALRVFSFLDRDASFKCIKNDGDRIDKGDIIAEITGKTGALLKGERTALNLLQHMSGIASETDACVNLCLGTDVKITDTRKTLPGLRALQKYAVVMGGGKNHRFNLSDGAMLKDNHIDAYGSISAAVSALRKKIGHMTKIETEARSLDEVKEAVQAGADVIMLDNMSVSDMVESVKICDRRAVLEASGNITRENIRQVAETGVDIISLGALTHSVKAFDISMKIKN